MKLSILLRRLPSRLGGISLAAIVALVVLPRSADAEPVNKDTADKDNASKDTVVLDKLVVSDTKPQPFTGANVDLPRGINDVQAYYILDSKVIARSGAINVEDFLKNRLTMNTVGVTNSQGGSGLGNSSSINLRGLGTSQTLILVDGRRRPQVNYGGSNLMQPDINGVPVAAIDRIEILPSSASAIYGGSAMGGVVNIIMKKDYNGGDIRMTYSNPYNTDNPVRTVDGTYGFAFNGGKTHVMLSGHYSDKSGIMRLQDRPMLTESYYYKLIANNPTFISFPRPAPPLGSTPNIASTSPLPGGGFENLTYKNGGASLNSTFATILPGTSVLTPASIVAGKYNIVNGQTAEQQAGLLFPFGSDLDETAFMASVRHQWLPKLEVFADFSTNTTNSYAPKDPVETAFGRIFVPSTATANPFNQNLVISFPNDLEIINTSRFVSRGFTLGAIAELPRNWKMEMDYTWSENINQYNQLNADQPAINAAIAANKIDVLKDTLAFLPGRIFLPYLMDARWKGGSTLNDVALRASGPIDVSLPGGKPALTAGLEHRKEGNRDGLLISEFPMTPANTVQTSYFGKAQSTNSVYLEANVPVLPSLELQVAGRSEVFTVGTGTVYYNTYPFAIEKNGYSGPVVHATTKYTSTNYTAGLRYSPVKSITFRASTGTAFLPPNFFQLLPNPVPSQPSSTPITDPKNGLTYSGYTTVQNLNSSLQPQSAKNVNVGVVFEPTAEALKGLRIDVEYFKITESNVIAGPPGGAQFIVSNANVYPNRVTRDSSGIITQIDTSSLNLFGLETTGWDISANYRTDTQFGIFNLYAIATIEESYKQQIALDQPLLEYVGYVGSGGPLKSKANSTLSWEHGPWTVAWSTSYFASYHEFGAPGDPQYRGNASAPLNTTYTKALGSNTVHSFIPHDVMVSWSSRAGPETDRVVDHVLARMVVSVGVKNVFHTAPPVEPFNPLYYNPFGDPRMREFWVSVKKDF